jgi:hypothetical protein
MLLLYGRNLFILCTKCIKLTNNWDVTAVYVCQKIHVESSERISNKLCVEPTLPS